ncbi:MAG TPA: GntG family PLP-dependent aldolase [Cyclobacteriaceae bacterium]|nr:GntG family PLP-dependent aldolase [Cyclobacteriaceae bacterium]
MLADLRSDTLTKPTPAMLQAMMAAAVGDDVFGEDPTLNALEQKVADMFGMGAAVFCPSGTMTNQIAIKILTQPYEEVICYEGAHIYKYEGGGMAGNSLVNAKLLKGDRGRISVEQISEVINPDDVHAAKSALVSLENTVNRGGGSYYRINEIEVIADMCRAKNLKLHLDGARLFNALVETGDSPKEYGKLFDTISICLSKGLGAPVGSLLLCRKELEKSARRIRKVFGGGMRQAGYLAAAGIYALDHHIERLKDDHARAKALAEVLQQCAFVEELIPVETNIIIFELRAGIDVHDFLNRLKEKNVLAVPFGARHIRFVTHLDFNDDMLSHTIKVLKSLS